jgi:hypothetical protein
MYLDEKYSVVQSQHVAKKMGPSPIHSRAELLAKPLVDFLPCWPRCPFCTLLRKQVVQV